MKQPNYDFTVYSLLVAMDYGSAWMRHAKDLANRPALMIVYEPGKEK